MRRSSIAFLLAFGALCAPVFSATAQETLPGERLEELEGQIEEGEVRLEEQEAEYRRLTGELTVMRERAVEISREVQDLERRISGTEARLFRLRQEETDTLADLDRRRVTLSDILAALQLLERNKPPALLVRPDDAVDAARSAMLLGAILPELEVQMTGLRAQLDALADVRQSIETEQDSLAASSLALGRERAELDQVMASRQAITEELARRVESERDQLAGFAAEATNLRELIERLTEQFSAASPFLRPSPNAPPIVSRFAEAVGSLRMPAAGRVLAQFGDTLASGTHSQGVAVATRPGAQVAAPFDSEIVFAAPYRGYGQMLILSPGDGYLIVISGLDRIDGVVGQELLTGEPVGIMGSQTTAPNLRRWAAAEGTPDEGQPVLYLEMREDGEPVDPLPWFREDQWRVDGS